MVLKTNGMIQDIHKQRITDIINRMADAINVSCRLELNEEMRSGTTVVNASIYAPDNAHLLIGKNGQNLQALEHLLRVAALKDATDTAITLDVNDYKKTKAFQVLELARKVVAQVRNTRKAHALAPMSSYERRVVHMELASYSDVVTESIGQDPQRRIVVKPL
jgi:spoIIIJ-associated protein